MKSVSSRSERRRQVKILRQKIIDGFKLSKLPAVLEDTGLSDDQFLTQAQQALQAWENSQQESTTHWILMVGLLSILSSLAMRSSSPSEVDWLSLNGGIRIGLATLGVSLSGYFICRFCCGCDKTHQNDSEESLMEMLGQLRLLVGQPVLKKEEEHSEYEPVPQADQKNISMKDKKPVKRKTNLVYQKIIKGEQQRKARQGPSIGASIKANVQWIKTWGHQTGIVWWNRVQTMFRLSPRQKKQKDDIVPSPQLLPLSSKKRRLVEPVKENLQHSSQQNHPNPELLTAAVETKLSSVVVTPSSGSDVMASPVQSAPITTSASNSIAEVKLDNRPVMESNVLNDQASKLSIEQPAGILNEGRVSQDRSPSLTSNENKETQNTEIKPVHLHIHPLYLSTLLTELIEEKKLRYQTQQAHQQSEHRLAMISQMLAQVQSVMHFVGFRLDWLENTSSESGTQPILVTTSPPGHWFGSLWQRRQGRPADPPASGLPPDRPLYWP